ncbi:MAG: transcriptional regulator [Desulfobacula sp.]|nr:transcriptional regulator [Desulfobacula sp.]
MKILNSKLQPPRLLNVLYRERLVALFKTVGQKKLITVVAGAGYGKTTLVIDALSRIDVKTVWFRLDQQDTDFMVFMTYLKFSIRQKRPETGKSALKSRNDFLLEFIKILENDISKETALVLDDYHLVQENPEINDAIEFILERLPQNVHLIIISRKEPPIRISKIRVMDLLLEISENDLSFTSIEIKDFYSKVYSFPVTNEHIKDIHEKTGGWAASLVLFTYALKGKKPEEIEKNLVRFKGSQKYIFSYLEENIFETQPREIQDFMLKICLLSVIDTTLYNRIFQINDAEKMLNHMIEDHLLIFRVDENSTVFYLHHLLRDFLIAKLYQSYSSTQISKLHHQIAVEIEPDDIFQALHHYIEGQDFDAAVRLIGANEIKFLLEGKIHFLGKCMEKIPKPVIERNPQLLFAEAKLFSHYGSPQEAIIKLKAAHKLFKKGQSNKDMIKCLIDLGLQYYFTGHLREAKLLMEQVLDEVDENSSTYIITMTFLIFLSSVLGEFDKAKKYTRQARDVISDYPDFERQISTVLIDTSYTYKYYITGEFNQSRVLNKKLLEMSLGPKFEVCLPLTYYHCSATSALLEKFEEGYDYAQKGLRICEKIGLLDSRKAWIYIAVAQNSLGLGRHKEAIDHLNLGIEIFEAHGNRWGLANAWDCLHHVYLEQKKTGQAKRLVTRALDIIDSYGLTITEGILENSMANVLIREKKFDAALNYLNKSRPKIKDAAFYMFENHLLTARCSLELDMQKEAVKHFIKGLEISEKKDFDRFIKKEKKWMIPLLKNKLLTGEPKKYIHGLFNSSRDFSPPALTLHLFGRFKLFIGEKKICSALWKSSKALMILKYLASNRHTGFIPREVLIELLWPEEDIQKTGKRFNVAMSALRKVLEPDISPRAPSAYIIRKKDAYRLCQDKDAKIDVEQFLEELGAAEKLKTKNPQKAMAWLLAAESCYKGPFLEEDPFEEWCIRKRDHLKLKYIEVLFSILSIYDAEKNYQNSIIYAKKILKTDPYNEEIFKKLMLFYAALGNTVNVKKTYENYKKMVKEIDCPVSRDTKSLYENLIQNPK